MRRNRIAALALATFVAVASLSQASPAFATRTLGLSAGSFRFVVANGQTARGTVYASNDGNESMRVLVYAADQTVDPNGALTFQTPSQNDLASLSKPSSWMRIFMPRNSQSIGNVPYVDLKPGQGIPVVFSVTVPPDVPSGDHNVMLFFEMVGAPGETAGSVSRVGGRLGSRITLRVRGPVSQKLAIGPFHTPQFVIGDSFHYDFLVQNQGNVDQRVVAKATLLDRSDSSVAQQTPLNGRLVFAQSNLEATSTMTVTTGSLFGPYTLRADVTPVDDKGNAVIGGPAPVSETRTIWFVPLWVVIIVVLLIVLIIGRLIWMAARRSARRQLERQQAASAMPQRYDAASFAQAPAPAAAPTNTATPGGPAAGVQPQSTRQPQEPGPTGPSTDEWADGGS